MMKVYSGVVTLIVVVIFGVYLWHNNQNRAAINTDVTNERGSVVRENDVKVNPYVNPAKVMEIGKHYIIDFSALRDKLRASTASQKSPVYVYFNYLNNGSWIGINEREEFTAASLVKVPLAMAVYKAVEDGRLSLDTKYALSESDLDSNFGDLYKVGVGQEYTMDELVSIMLRQSDNTAKNAITSIFTKVGIMDPLQDVYVNLGWDFLPALSNGDNVTPDQNYTKISLKVLSNMFVALYNATYINIEHSQAILEHLTQTSFSDEIDAGVPDDISVSHKIGVGGADNTYSDCGIVYAPNRHYLLCIGTEGLSEKQADVFMADISRQVYDYVISN